MSYQDPKSPDVPPSQPTSSKDENMWAMFCHLSALAGLLIPTGNIVGPLVVWLVKKDEMPLVNDQGKESLNFQISLTIYFVIASAISGILIMAFIGIILLPIVVVGFPIFGTVMAIIAALRANEGQAYRYPLCIRFIA